MYLRHNPDKVFAQLGTIVLGEQPLPQILERVVHLASEMLPGAAQASITLLNDGHASTLASTGAMAIALDERQYQDGSGPCLHCARSGLTVVVPNMAAEGRWPRFAEDAQRRGVCRSLSVPLVRRNIAGSLNYYVSESGAFDQGTIDVAETFAGHAAVAVANAHLYETTAALAEQMRQAMASRAVIEQAKGVVMRDRGCSSDEAFEFLVHFSQATNVKLRDLAQRIVDDVAGGRPALARKRSPSGRSRGRASAGSARQGRPSTTDGAGTSRDYPRSAGNGFRSHSLHDPA